jgi:hypothetical protein
VVDDHRNTRDYPSLWLYRFDLTLEHHALCTPGCDQGADFVQPFLFKLRREGVATGGIGRETQADILARQLEAIQGAARQRRLGGDKQQRAEPHRHQHNRQRVQRWEAPGTTAGASVDLKSCAAARKAAWTGIELPG